MRLQSFFDLAWIDQEPLYSQDVISAGQILESPPCLADDDSQVTGAKPVVWREGARGCVVVVEISRGQGRPLELKFTDRAAWENLIVLGCAYGHVVANQGAARLTAYRGVGLKIPECGKRQHFGRSVHIRDSKSELALGAIDDLAKGCSGRKHDAQRLKGLARRSWMIEHPPQDRFCQRHDRNAARRDRFDQEVKVKSRHQQRAATA